MKDPVTTEQVPVMNAFPDCFRASNLDLFAAPTHEQKCADLRKRIYDQLVMSQGSCEIPMPSYDNKEWLVILNELSEREFDVYFYDTFTSPVRTIVSISRGTPGRRGTSYRDLD